MNDTMIECIKCKAYSWWDGDPCCTRKLQLVLPDFKKDCEDFEHEEDSRTVEHNQNTWNVKMRSWFKHMKIKEPIYSQYIEQHPHYANFIKREENV